MLSTVAVFVKLLFDDKRCTSIVLVAWVVLSLTLLYVFTRGLEKVAFMHLGPSDTVKIIDIPINNWGRWWGVALFTFCNTSIAEFVDSALVPWFQNTIQVDHCVCCLYIFIAVDMDMDADTWIMSLATN